VREFLCLYDNQKHLVGVGKNKILSLCPPNGAFFIERSDMFINEMEKLFEELAIKRNSKRWADYEKAKQAYCQLEDSKPSYYYPKYGDFINILTRFVAL